MPTINATDISKSITQVAKNIEYLKVLYEHQSRVSKVQDSTVDEKSVKRLEDELALAKWNLVENLSDPKVFEQWVQSDKNQAHMLYKYFAKGHFIPETGLNTELLQQFKSLERFYLQATPESLLTSEEQQRLKHAQTNLVPESRRYQYAREDVQVVDIYLKEKAFDKALTQLTQYPSDNALTQKILQRVKDNPIFLKNHPAHSMVNPRGGEPTLNALELYELVQNQDMEKLKKVDQTFDNLVSKKPLSNMIQNMRKYSKEISNELAGPKM